MRIYLSCMLFSIGLVGCSAKTRTAPAVVVSMPLQPGRVGC